MATTPSYSPACALRYAVSAPIAGGFLERVTQFDLGFLRRQARLLHDRVRFLPRRRAHGVLHLLRRAPGAGAQQAGQPEADGHADEGADQGDDTFLHGAIPLVQSPVRSRRPVRRYNNSIGKIINTPPAARPPA
jgi:hypothetical protein